MSPQELIKKEAIIEDINSHILYICVSRGVKSSEWVFVLSDDDWTTLSKLQHIDMENDFWIFRRAENKQTAKAVIDFFRSKNYSIVGNKGTCVFAYHKRTL